MKYWSKNPKLDFPDFSINLDSCKTNCDIYNSSLAYCKNNVQLKINPKVQNKHKLNIKMLDNGNLKPVELEALRSNYRKLRIFSFGDFRNFNDVKLILDMCHNINSKSNIMIWISTRAFNALWDFWNKYPNYKIPNNTNIRFSYPLKFDLDPFCYNFLKSHGLTFSKIVRHKNKSNCHSSKKNNSIGCKDCELCFSKEEFVYYYPHGKRALKYYDSWT